MKAGDGPPLTLEWLAEADKIVAVLDGTRFVGTDAREIHTRVVSAAARRAADTPDGAVTVVIRERGVEKGRWRVTELGEVAGAPADDGAAVQSQARDEGAETDETGADRAASTAGGPAEGRHSAPRAEDGRRGRPRRGAHTVTSPRGASRKRLGRGPRQLHAPRHFIPISRGFVIPAVACGILLLVFGAWTLLRGSVATGPTTVRGERLAAAAPLEWSQDSLWRTPALLADAGRVLVADGRVAFVTSDRRVVLVDAVSGETRWSAPYPAGDPRTDLTVSTIDNHEVIACQVGDRLAWWDPHSGEAGGLDLPEGSSVVLRGTAPLVLSGDGRTAALVRDGRLATAPLPDGATALAGRADGLITAAGSAGWWHLTPGQPLAAPRTWEIPGGTGAPSLVSYLGGSIISLLSSGTDSAPQILVFTDREHDVRFAWIGPGVFEERSATWHPSPSRNWGILGRTLVDLDAGRATDLGQWSTQLVSADRALGDLAGEQVLVGPTIPLGSLQHDESFPEDLTDSGALVRSRLGTDEVVYLLPPKDRP